MGPEIVTINSSNVGRFPCSSRSTTPPNGSSVILLILQLNDVAAIACPNSWQKIIMETNNTDQKLAVRIPIHAINKYRG